MSEAESVEAGTTYVVLRHYEPDDVVDVTRFEQGGWKLENRNVPAASAEAAIRLVCKHAEEPSGTYVAVPSRSWKPVTVKAETTTVLRLT